MEMLLFHGRTPVAIFQDLFRTGRFLEVQVDIDTSESKRSIRYILNILALIKLFDLTTLIPRSRIYINLNVVLYE